MTKLVKIWITILLIVMVVEIIVSVVLPIVSIINGGDWSGLVLWVFVPGLVVAVRLFYGYLKGEDE